MRNSEFGIRNTERRANHGSTRSKIKKLFFYIVKGGAGKTTLVVNIAAAIGELDRKVLVVDMDPQAHSTFSLGIPEPSIEKSLYATIINKRPIKEIIQKTRFKNIWIAPATIDMFGLDYDISLRRDHREELVAQAFSPITDEYDYILIDSNPNFNWVVINALYACDALIVPVECGVLPFRGIKPLNIILEQIKRDYDKEIPILGYVVTKYHKNHRVSEEILSQIKKNFGDKVFKTIINYNTTIAEAPVTQEPIEYYARYSRGAKDHIALAKEVIARVEETI